MVRTALDFIRGPFQESDRLVEVRRDTIHYLKGGIDFREKCGGEWDRQSKDSDCPYPVGDSRRVNWFAGWLDGRVNARLSDIFEKYGLKHP
jgi:hypothetical protein